MANTNTLSPKIGFAYDLSGDNRTVVKAFYGLSRWNSADTLADQENPVGIAALRYQFVSCSATRTTLCDLNGNRLVDSPAELGAYQTSTGGAGNVRVDRDLVRPTSNEISVNVEREIKTVANVTARDVQELLPLAAAAGIRPTVTTYALEDANRALLELRRGGVRGAKVLAIRPRPRPGSPGHS